MSDRPDISFIVPCYNEEEAIPFTLPQLLDAFEAKDIDLELVAVDNGSTDRTAEIIDEFIAAGRRIVKVTVEENQGYGFGVLSSFSACRARWIGIIPADGQVDAEDVVRLYEAVASSDSNVIGKVRRRFRMDGPLRKVISIAYNAFVFCLWPRLGSIDINGSPKILPAWAIEPLELSSKQWFLDPEMMVKAHYLGIRTLEMNVFARMRSNGLSHVRLGTCLEFFTKLLGFKLGGRLRSWRKKWCSDPERIVGLRRSATASR